jgi:GTP-binding protein Era
MHTSDAVFNQSLTRAARRAMADADIVLWLVEASQPEDPPGTRDDQLILEDLRQRKTAQPVILALTKVDRVDKPRLLPLLARWQEVYPLAEIVPVSATKGDNVDRLESLLVRYLPEGHPFYPPEELSDRPERFFIAEVIREKAFSLLRQELPYAVAVEVEAVRAREGRDLTDVEATIYVEKESQKAIVIGTGGKMLKRIGEQARPEIEDILGTGSSSASGSRSRRAGGRTRRPCGASATWNAEPQCGMANAERGMNPLCHSAFHIPHSEFEGIVPLHSTEAIVIGGHDLAEADRIVVFYTNAAGKVRVVAQGARRLRSRFGGSLQLFTEGRLVYFGDPTRPCTR